MNPISLHTETARSSRDIIIERILWRQASSVLPSSSGSTALAVAITFLVCSPLAVRALRVHEQHARATGQPASTLELHGPAAVMPRVILEVIQLPFRILGLMFALLGCALVAAGATTSVLHRLRRR